MFRKFIGKFWISHKKFLITLHIFRGPLVILSAPARCQRCINTRPLEFTPFIGDFVGNCELPTNADGRYPSVWTSVIVAFPVNIYATLCEMPTDDIRRYWRRW
jgi:hypothetical protein